MRKQKRIFPKSVYGPRTFLSWRKPSTLSTVLQSHKLLRLIRRETHGSLTGATLESNKRKPHLAARLPRSPDVLGSLTSSSSSSSSSGRPRRLRRPPIHDRFPPSSTPSGIPSIAPDELGTFSSRAVFALSPLPRDSVNKEDALDWEVSQTSCRSCLSGRFAEALSPRQKSQEAQIESGLLGANS